MQKTIDLSIKNHELGSTEGGYHIENRKTYREYADNLLWALFIDDMEKNHPAAFNEYGSGAGGELKAKGSFPPKMASYGSSSRMIYNLCKDISGFHFEYQMPTKIGGVANLDGFMEKEDEFVFVEAKCREIYATKPHLIEKKYEKLYRYISSDERNNLCIRATQEEKKINVTFLVDSTEISRFDIKQMICHLLGIAVKLLKEPIKKKISFLYLCYNPQKIKILDEKKEKDILAAYAKMCDECQAIDFKKLFESIVLYLHEEMKVGVATARNIDEMVEGFEFVLCDQTDFVNYLC